MPQKCSFDYLKQHYQLPRLQQLVSSLKPTATATAAPEDVSPDEFAQQWAAFARRCKIKSGRQMLPFQPYDLQIQLVKGIAQHPGAVVAKTRQLGLTECVANLFLYKATINPAYSAVVFSKTGSDTAQVAERVKLMAAGHVPLAKANTQEIQVLGGGRIIFATSTGNSGRGLPSISDIFFDEWSFVRLASEIYGSAVPSTAMVGEKARIIMASTPNGTRKGQQYWDILSSYNGERDIKAICHQVRTGEIDPIQQWTDEQGWLKFVCHWRAHPTYNSQPDYLDQVRKKNKISLATLRREFDLGFDDSTEEAVVKAEWFGQYGTPHYNYEMIVQSWDTAAKKGDTACPWACTTWGIYNGTADLLDAYTQRHAYPDGKRAVQSLFLKWRPSVLIIEDASSGSMLIQEIRQDGIDGIWPSVFPVRPKGDKITRMALETPTIESGRVRLPESAPWLPEWLAVVTAFPYGEINDPVDSLSQFLLWWREHGSIMQPALSPVSETSSPFDVDYRI